jgi:L-aspartate oxidase
VNRAELVVVGSGVAGLYAALTAAVRGLEVALLTKDALADSNSWYAQGGLSAVGPAGVAAGDSIASHITDTLTAGAQLNDADAVAIMCTSAWGHVQRLVGAGAEFDTDPSGTFALGLEAAHAHPRILHAGGDATGKYLASALIAACRAQEAAGRLVIREHAFVTELLTEGNPYAEAGSDRPATMVTGVRVLGRDGQRDELHSEAVLLATGGAGQLFAATTNPHGATGDGAALAYRAGAVLADAEFIQFHPTLVSPGGFMVSEAVRGEGAASASCEPSTRMQSLRPGTWWPAPSTRCARRAAPCTWMPAAWKPGTVQGSWPAASPPSPAN